MKNLYADIHPGECFPYCPRALRKSRVPQSV